MRVKIHHEGTEILIVGGLILAALNVPLWLWLGKDLVMIPMVVTAASVVFYLFVVNFFRSPRRKFKGDVVNAVVASADGKVVALEKVYEPEVLKCEVIQLSVFMSPLNVHANWFPVDGTVEYVAHHSGRFLSAYLPKASTDNERSTIGIQADCGARITVRQIAGAMARRIVTYAYKGEEASIDEHLGFIKFGSRVDLYLPVDTEILVNIGDITRGGLTPVARFNTTSKKSQ